MAFYNGSSISLLLWLEEVRKFWVVFTHFILEPTVTDTGQIIPFIPCPVYSEELITEILLFIPPNISPFTFMKQIIK